jgi:uncharacterized membrane protein YcaP (DUF421 family)
LGATFWKELPTQVWHTAVLYAIAFLVLRLMGKRSLGRMAPFDVVVVIMIGEAAAMGMEETNRSIFTAIVPVAVLGLLQFALSWVNARYPAVEKVTQGTDTTVVQDGRFQKRNLASEHLSVADVMAGLREQGVERLSDVKTAKLEPTGQISVIKKASAGPATPKTMGLHGEETLEELIDRKLDELRRELTQLVRRQAKV